MIPVTMTDVERLQLVNQFRILQKLDPENEKRYATFQEILEQGIASLYNEVFEGIWREKSLEQCHLVESVIEMFLVLQHDFDKLQDIVGLDSKEVFFPGFPTEDQFFVALYLKKRWAKRDTTLKMAPDRQALPNDRYVAMLTRWRVIQERKEKPETGLTKEEIKEILSADDTEE